MAGYGRRRPADGGSAPEAPARAATPATAPTPEARLAGWADEHPTLVAAESERRREDAKPKRGAGWIDPEARDARNRRRSRAAAGTRKEVDGEVARARAGGVTDGEVDEIIARKELESRIEMTYGLEFTESADEPYGESHWTLPELQQIDAALEDVPAAHLKKLERVNRSRRGRKETTGALYDSDPKSHTIQVFDAIDYAPGTNSGVADPITGRTRPSRYRGGKSTSMGDIFQHEVGHAVAEAMPDAYKRFTRAAGWSRDVHGAVGTHEHDASKVTTADPYSKGTVSRDEGAIPKGAGWQYASVAPEEHFAEVYAKALQVPATLHEELIAAPQRRLDEADSALRAALADQRAAAGDMAAFNAAAARVGTASAERDAAAHAVTAMRQQWTVMREQVFGVDQTKIDAQARRLAASGTSADGVRAFREEAAKAMTPKQLATLATRFSGR